MRKKYFFLLCGACALIAAALAGCEPSTRTPRGMTAQGSPYEIVVVSNTPTWEGPAGDTLRSMLRQPVPAISRNEPMFDLLRVTPDGFKNIIAKHRNIIKLLVNPTVEAGIGVQYDVSSHPQTVILVQAPDQTTLAQYLSDNRSNLLYVLEKSERDRTLEYAGKFNEPSLRALLKDKFGITMNVPKGYVLRNAADDFVWISYEYPSASQGFFIYTYPYKGVESLSAGALTKARNRFAALIPGPSEGSYMTTYDGFEPESRAIRIGGRLWIEMRGLWDVAHDFMGGPFVSYSTVDTETNRVLTLDCYVYSPQKNQRNYLRALEHLVYLIEFPADAVPTPER